MPYIDKNKREKYDKAIELLLDELRNDDKWEGSFNYIISRIMYRMFYENTSYSTINALVGVLESAKLNFYDMRASAYEKNKVSENGDVEDYCI